MKISCFFQFIFLFVIGCSTQTTHPENKKSSSNNITPFEEKDFPKTKLNDWEFLKENPTEIEVFQMYGTPDSIWVDEYGEFKILYYFVPSLQDYNSIEIDIKQRRVSGLEWD